MALDRQNFFLTFLFIPCDPEKGKTIKTVAENTMKMQNNLSKNENYSATKKTAIGYQRGVVATSC